jgi:hypothetical protein
MLPSLVANSLSKLSGRSGAPILPAFNPRLAMNRMPLITILLCLLLASMASATAEESSHLVSGSLLAPGLIPPGWIADHLPDYTNNRGAYGASCRTDAVVGELQALSKQVDHEEDLRHTARGQLQYAVVGGESTAKRRTDLAINALGPLDKDIATIDGLLVRLSSLPDCDNATASPVPASQPPKEPPLQNVTASPAAPSPEPLPPVTPAEPAVPALPTQPSANSDASVSPSPDSDIFVVVRFDPKMAGLTPTSIRTLNGALRALGEGRKVQIAIEGCEANDSAPEGGDCLERTRRLKRILSDDGIGHPADLIAKPH